jgi:hypothetical protein
MTMPCALCGELATTRSVPLCARCHDSMTQPVEATDLDWSEVVRGRGRRTPRTEVRVAPDTAALSCSFCGRPRAAVRKLVAGERAFICDRCVERCRHVLDSEP